MAAAIREANTRPGTIAGRAFAKAVYGMHPYGYETTEETLAKIGVTDMRQMYNRTVAPCRAKVSMVGAVTREQADALGGDAGVARGDARVLHGVGKVGRALGEDAGSVVDVLEDVGDRVLVLVAHQFGQPLGQPLDAVDQFRRRVEQGAKPARRGRDDRAALRTGLLDRATALDRAVELDFADPGEADALDLRRGALEDGGVGIDLDPHPHEFGPLGEQADLLDFADRNARKGHAGALGQAADALAEIDVEAFGGLVRQPGQPDGEQQQAREQQQDDGPDQHMVRTRFHQESRCPFCNPAEAARPRGPLKYSWIQGWSSASNSSIVPTATTFLSDNTATRSQIA